METKQDDAPPEIIQPPLEIKHPAGQPVGNPQVTCTPNCKLFIDQVEATYTPTYARISDIFVTLCSQEHVSDEKARHYPDPAAVEINSIFQTLACWGLTRTRHSVNQFTLREVSLFLNSLEEAAFHLRKALLVESRPAPKN